jgi:hypothetical protein
MYTVSLELFLFNKSCTIITPFLIVLRFYMIGFIMRVSDVFIDYIFFNVGLEVY